MDYKIHTHTSTNFPHPHLLLLSHIPTTSGLHKAFNYLLTYNQNSDHKHIPLAEAVDEELE